MWQAIKGYVWWTYERGSVHYDVMVTLILIFVFFSHLVIDFGDKPAPVSPHPIQASSPVGQK